MKSFIVLLVLLFDISQVFADKLGDNNIDWNQERGPISDTVAYVQISSVASQTTAPGVGSLVVGDTIELNKNFQVSPNFEYVRCTIPGVYLLCCAMQPAAFVRGISGYLDSWFELNGKQILETTVRQYITETSPVALMSNSFLIKLEVGDIVSNRIRASRGKIGVIFIQSSLSSQPSISSYLFTAFKVY